MVTQEQILEALRGINDPEMPISIVDLGIVERIYIESAEDLEAVGNCASSARGATGGLPPVSARAGEPPASARADEPPVAPFERPVEGCEPHAEPGAFEGDFAKVSIDILPTFVGCPALPMIEREIREKVGALAGVASAEVRFRFDPPWSVDRISAAGRAALSLHGVTVPQLVQLNTPASRPGMVRCPFCGSDSTRMESAYGPTRCRMIYYCESCRNSFEHLKRV